MQREHGLYMGKKIGLEEAQILDTVDKDFTYLFF